MKTLYTSLMAMLLSFTALAQTSTIFHENFNATAVDVAVTGTWGRANTAPLHEGTYYVTNSNDGTISKTINVTGFSTVELSWYERIVAVNNKNITRSLVITDNNGRTYTTTYSTASEIANSEWEKQSISMSSLANTVTSLTFTWTIRRTNGQSHRYAIDDVIVKGEAVKPSLTFPISQLTFNAQPGGESEAKPYTLNGTGLSSAHKVLISAPANFKIKIGTSDFVSSLELTPNADGSLSQEILVKYYGAASGPHSGTIKHVYNTLEAHMSVSGVTAPSVTAPALLEIDAKIGSPTVKEFTLSATNLTAGLTVTSSGAPFLISRDGINYGISFTLPHTLGNIKEAKVYVQYESALIGNHEGALTYTSTGLTASSTTLKGATSDQSAAPLPVELASFQVQTVAGAAHLVWITATEENNDRFFVERSLDGSNFKVVGEVKGQGNSTVKVRYAFTDKLPLSGTNYYRLRQVDFDGTVAYSNIVALDVAAKGGLEAVVYPTVASRTLTISLQHASADAAISVVDATGRVVAQLAGVAAREIELPVHSFRNGVYYVKITDGLNQKVQRFIKE